MKLKRRYPQASRIKIRFIAERFCRYFAVFFLIFSLVFQTFPSQISFAQELDGDKLDVEYTESISGEPDGAAALDDPPTDGVEEPGEHEGDPADLAESDNGAQSFGSMGVSQACTAPAYCTADEDVCKCKTEGASDCVCEDDCACRKLVQEACRSPLFCKNNDCLCGQLGEEYCTCDSDCACFMPFFSVSTETSVTDGGNIKTGAYTSVSVNFEVSSTEATFSDVIIKTYVQGPLEVSNLDIDGVIRYWKTEVENGYTVLYARCDTTGVAAGEYSFDVRFPAGVTPAGKSARVYTVVEGKLHSEGNAWDFIEGDYQKVTEAFCTAQAESKWTLAVNNTDLDYKDPNSSDDRIFRQEFLLKRNPESGEGVYYLDLNSPGLAIHLPGAPDGHANVLRVTKANGEAVRYSYENGVLQIAAEDLPLNGSQADGYSSGSSAAVYVVFELSENYLVGIGKNVTGTDFSTYNCQTTAAFSYTLAGGGNGIADGESDLLGLIYTPGQGGHGSIGKWAKPFIEGSTFFAAGPSLTPIEYNIRYVNNSNTPVERLVITDELPKLLTLTKTGTAEAAVPAGSVYFRKVTVGSWDDNYVEGNVTCEVVYSISGEETRMPVQKNGSVDIPHNAEAIKIAFDGVLRHGFDVNIKVEIGGDPALAGADAEAKAKRDLISLVENTAKFSAVSSRDHMTPLSGAHSFPVHVYPFDNLVQNPKWTLTGLAGPSVPGLATTQAVIARGRDVYYRIVVSPEDLKQYAYTPVFYLELPPEIIFDESDAANITYSGAVSGIPFTSTVIPNPLGRGAMLKISCSGKWLLNPMANGAKQDGVITVKCKIDADTPQGTPIESKIFFGVTDPSTLFDPADYPDPAGYQSDGSGEHFFYTTDTGKFGGENMLLKDSVTVKAQGTGLLEGELWVQTELDRESNTWRRHPEIASALPGGQLTYKFVVRNGGTKPAKDIVLYNVFSNIDDFFIISPGRGRESQWQPYLTGPVAAPGATIEYSEYSDHKVINKTYSGTDDWTEHPYNYPGVQSIRLKLSQPLNPGEEFVIQVPMYAPVDYIFKDGADTPLATSSLATVFKFEDSGTTNALEPLKATVKLTRNTAGEISGIVWGDANPKNGNIDTDEFPEAGVTVALYKDGVFVRDAVTNLAGEYKFTNLAPGKYTVRVVMPDGYAPGGAGDDNKFSENAGKYESAICEVKEDAKVFDHIDAGIYPTPTTISGHVWRNLDGSGKRSAEPGKDTAIGNSTVELHRMAGAGKSALYKTTATDQDGAYSFADVPAGRYFVVFQKSGNYTYSTRWAPDGSATGNAEMPGFSQALATAPASNQIAGQSYEIWLQAGTPQKDIDCGLTPLPGSISGVIWRDANGNGARDSGEDGTGSFTVKLNKTAGYGAQENLASANASNGAFSFTGLTPGEYEVVFDGTDTGDYVSCVTTAIGEGDRVFTGAHSSIEIDPAGTLTYTGKNFGVVQKFAISGRVYNDKNANASFGGSDAALAANGIVLQRTSGGDGSAFNGSTNTDGDGKYALTGLWPGNYTVGFLGKVQGSDGVTAYENYLVTTPNANGFNRATRVWTLTNMLSGSTKGSDKDLALTRPRTISGVAWHDLDGSAAMNGAEEYLARNLTITKAADSLSGAYSGNGVSAANSGGYAFTGLYPGDYVIQVNLSDTPTNYMVTNAITNVLGSDGKYKVTIPKNDDGVANDPRQKDFGLAKPVTISGHVWRDMDINAAADYQSNGVYDVTDQNLKLDNVAALYRWNGSDYTPAGTASTNADGIYTFTGKLPGTYQVVISPAPATHYLTGPAATTVNTATGAAAFTGENDTSVGKWDSIKLQSDERVSGLDLSVGLYRYIRGALWHDTDGDGVKDGGEAPLLTGETITLLRGDAAAGSVAASTTDGKYSFKIKPGQYKVLLDYGAHRVTNLSDTGFKLVPPNAEWSVDYTDSSADGDIVDKDFLLAIYASISGDVWVDKDGDGVKSAGESAKSGVSVTLRNTQTYFRAWWDEYTNNDDYKTIPVTENGYKFDKLWPGAYTVTLSGDIDGYMRTNLSTNAKVTQVGENQWQWGIVVDSDVNTEANFGVVKPSSLAGDFFGDTDGNKAKNGAETGIGTAKLYRAASGAMMGYDTTVPVPESGGFQFAGLLPGQYTLTFAHADANLLRTVCAQTLGAAGALGSGATIAATGERAYTIIVTDADGTGVAASGAVAGYTSPSAISGSIFADNNNNDQQDGGENNLSGATAVLKRYDGSSYVGGFTPTPGGTNANGGFQFTGLLPGKYELTFSGVGTQYLITTPDKTVGTTPAKADFAKSSRKWMIEIAQEGQSVTLSTGVVAMGKISGYVWKDADANGAKNAEDFYSGQTVNLYLTSDRSTVIDTKITGGNGEYSFTGLYPGDYVIEVVKPGDTWYVTNTGGDVLTNANAQSATIAAGSTITGKDFGITQLIFTLGGKVWLDKGTSPDGIYNPPADEAAAYASVTATGPGGYSETVTTDANGNYSFANLVPGSYTIAVAGYDGYVLTNHTHALTEPEGSATLAAAAKRWEIAGRSGYSEGKLDFPLAEKAFLTVRVFEDLDGDGDDTANDNPMEDIVVKVYGGVGYADLLSESSLKTGSDGTCSLMLSNPGDYRAVIEKPSAAWGVTNPPEQVERFITVRHLGEVIAADFRLAQYVAFSGHVWTEYDGNGSFAAADGDEDLNGHPVVVQRNGVDAKSVGTGADGSFSITAADKILPGDFAVIFAAKANYYVSNTGAGFAQAGREWSFALESGGGKTGLDCAFTPYRSISGAVWEDSDGNGTKEGGEDYLAGKTATLNKWDGSAYREVASALSGPDGKFTFNGLLPGKYEVLLTAPGYLRTNPGSGQGQDDLYTRIDFIGDDSVTQKSCLFGLALPVSFSGLSFLDKNGSGAYNADRDALCPTSVTIARTGANPATIGTFQIGPDGSYDTSAYTLLPGAYTVTFGDIPGHTAIANADTGFDKANRRWAFALASGGSRGDINIGYQRAQYIITGYVWKDVNGDGAIDSGEGHFTDLDSISITAARGGSTYSAAVGSDGKFTIMADLPGEYKISAALPAGYQITNRGGNYNREDNDFTVTLTYGDFSGHVDVGASEYFTISGMLWLDLNADSLCSGVGEDPIESAAISLIDAEGNAEATTQTDNLGKYVFAGVKPGIYTVQLSQGPTANYFLTGYAGSGAPDPQTSAFNARTGQWVLTVAQQNIDHADSGYHEPSEIAGALHDSQTGAAIPNTKAKLYKKDAGGDYILWDETVTDASGNYSFARLTAGDYRLTVDIPAGYQFASSSGGALDGSLVVAEISIAGMGEEIEELTTVKRPAAPPNNGRPSRSGGDRSGKNYSITLGNAENPADTINREDEPANGAPIESSQAATNSTANPGTGDRNAFPYAAIACISALLAMAICVCRKKTGKHSSK